MIRDVKVLGVDLGTSLGLAEWHVDKSFSDAKLWKATTFDIKGEDVERTTNTFVHLQMYYDHIDYICVEYPGFAINSRLVFEKMFTIYGAFQIFCGLNEVEMYNINIPTWRKMVLGKSNWGGRKEAKQAAVNYITTHHHIVKLPDKKTSREDACEAACIGLAFIGDRRENNAEDD